MECGDRIFSGHHVYVYTLSPQCLVASLDCPLLCSNCNTIGWGRRVIFPGSKIKPELPLTYWKISDPPQLGLPIRGNLGTWNVPPMKFGTWNMSMKKGTRDSPCMKSGIWNHKIHPILEYGKRENMKLGTWNKVILKFEVGNLHCPP